MELETMDSTRTFWTSFVDGFTGEGIFGVRVPGAPSRMFLPEPQAEPILVLCAAPGLELCIEEILKLRTAVQRAADESLGEGAAVVTLPPGDLSLDISE